MNHLFRMLVALVIGVGLIATQPARTDEKPAKKKSKRAWTLEEARAALALDPHDPYLQYVVLQLARREKPNKLDEVAESIEALVGRGREERGRTAPADLFSIFSGASRCRRLAARHDARRAPAFGLPEPEPESIGKPPGRCRRNRSRIPRSWTNLRRRPRPRAKPESELFTFKGSNRPSGSHPDGPGHRHADGSGRGQNGWRHEDRSQGGPLYGSQAAYHHHDQACDSRRAVPATVLQRQHNERRNDGALLTTTTLAATARRPICSPSRRCSCR